MIDYKSLRPGNWIHPTGRSKYVVVTGLLLGMMEKNADLCKEFEGIELTGELLEAAGFEKDGFNNYNFSINPFPFYGTCKLFFSLDYLFMQQGKEGLHESKHDLVTIWNKDLMKKFYLHRLQNLIFDFTGSELPLPESALIIPQGNQIAP